MLNDSSVKSLSKKTGASKDEVSSVLTAALPLLLKGAGQQAEDEETAESFADALDQHAESDTEDMDVFMKAVQDAYWEVKKINKEKYTPKKYRKDDND